VFNFYFNSSSVYKQVGFSAAMNAATIPVIYSPHDVIYNLPLQFGADDSSASGYELDLTSTLGLYYKVNRTRHTVADGWGTLTTPYGTFNALRVLSTISERDSIYIDSLSFGFTTPAVITKEYKWLGTGEGIPLLQINTTNNGVVTQITYKDSLPGSTTGMPDQIAANPIRSLFPNPAAGASVLNIDLRQASLVKIQVLDGTGQVVYQSPEQKMDAGNHFSLLNNETQKLNAGTYFVRLFVDGKTSMQKLIVVE
ncbi:MAG TPA: T9SS type A sorting domain-containing protein, partial [Bacteroidia bacterium]|nr:T9SS type A sorting domain-containing protein [Bacteroidia bacterium]